MYVYCNTYKRSNIFIYYHMLCHFTNASLSCQFKKEKKRKNRNKLELKLYNNMFSLLVMLI